MPYSQLLNLEKSTNINKNMKTTTKIKLALQKKLPEALFLKTLSAYRMVAKFKPYSLDEIKLLSFKKAITKKLNYKNINYKLVLNPENGLLDKNIYINGPYEGDILNEFMKVIKSGDTCLDVGANIGHHSIFLAKLVGETGKVVAFEPIQRLADQIKNSAKENNLENLKVIVSALGEKNYDTVIHINKYVIGSSSLLPTRYGTDVEKINIKVSKLDDIFSNLNIQKIDFIKIDVEGYEWFVLDGGRETIAAHRPKIVIEYSPEYYRQNDVTHMDKIIDFLRENNYSIYDIENKNKEILDDEDFKNSFGVNLRSQTNLLCSAK
jgi:FkbM family methyltransferase